MFSPDISDDDESFERPRRSTAPKKHQNNDPKLPDIQPILISSDDESDHVVNITSECLTSDDDPELPIVHLKEQTDDRDRVIKTLFPGNINVYKPGFATAGPSNTKIGTSSKSAEYVPKPVDKPGHHKMIGGVPVNFPVPPYGAQIALMSKVIKGINDGVNCLLESPTGSGKTLALLCGALAWQKHERDLISNSQAQQCIKEYPELNGVKGAFETIASPPGSATVSPEKLFSRPAFGERSIYDEPGTPNGCAKRQEPYSDSSTGSPEPGLVSIHKKRRIDTTPTKDNTTPGDDCKAPSNDCKAPGDDCKAPSNDCKAPGNDCKAPSNDCKAPGNNCKAPGDDCKSPGSDCKTPSRYLTPEKQQTVNAHGNETPKNVRQLYSLIGNLQLRTSMFVACSVPTIYYGARTHKQIKQVVKEFSRTAYCGEAKMTVLSSREYSCVRQFDRSLYANKNDMCKECVKRVRVDRLNDAGPPRTNCNFYDNRAALNHSVLPGAFDLDDLVEAGNELKACPFYAARLMAAAASIVFCPYNYLIDPSIRESLSIELRGNIVILDEAHNIEDICRDAATFTITKDQVDGALMEFERIMGYQYANQDIMDDIANIVYSLKNWSDWFGHQLPLVANKPLNNNEAVHIWQVEHFVTTLNNHNIGVKQYKEFAGNVEAFCRKLRDDPQSLYGVTQSTGTLVEAISTCLGYLFRDECKHMDDFKPALIRGVVTSRDNDPRAWRSSQFNQTIDKELLSLRLMCMHPGVVFSSLLCARTVLLSSGTLAPMHSLHSELGAAFPLSVSPPHVVPRDRVWIGTLSTGPSGSPLQCKAQATSQVDVQDALGDAVLWTSQVTPNGVLCFLPSYMLMNKLVKRWMETGLWRKLESTKNVFMESRIVKDHNDVMDDYYRCAPTSKGALLFAVYRGKVSEGMDFKDEQARAVITVGIPYPNTFDMMVKEKMNYNDRHTRDKQLLSSGEWLRVQAYRALNQAVGRCVRHRTDWGAVLLVDARFTQPYYTEHLSKWVRNYLGNNHHTYESLVNSTDSMESFMQAMTLREKEEDA